MNIITEQNGGAESFYVYEDEESFDEDDLTDEELLKKKVVECYQKKRSYILADINEDIYNKLNKNIKYLRYACGKEARGGGLKICVYKPGEPLDFERELVVTEDYIYPDKTECYSTVFTCDIIEENGSDENTIDTYRLFGIDMIWCREDTLEHRLKLLSK